jgi:hypothetical protein
LLLEKGYEVHGIIRRASTFNTSRIDHLYADPHINGVRMFLHYGDLSDSVNLVKLLYELKPDEIYHLGAQSHVRVSFDIPEYTSDVTAVGTIRILNTDYKRNCSSVTWTRNGIGDMRLSTLMACGEFFSKTKETISCWLLVKPTACVSLPKRPFHTPILIGKNSSDTTSVMSARRK